MATKTILTVVIAFEILNEKEDKRTPDVLVDSWQISSAPRQRVIETRQKIKELLGKVTQQKGLNRIVSVSHSIETQVTGT